MLDTVLDKAGERIAETAHRATRATAAMTEAFEDGIGLAKRAAKHSADAAEEFMEDTQQRIKRHPVETVVASFAIGTAFGMMIGWAARRK
jgi:ElaB/YqjD/DUF883 family membrane-anchored ribosome-binding protein